MKTQGFTAKPRLSTRQENRSMGLSNAHVIRGSVTISHGANIAAHSTNQTTVAFTPAALGDRVVVSPNAAPVAGILVGSARVSTTGVIQVDVANVTTATVAAGTAVVYNVTLIKGTGQV